MGITESKSPLERRNTVARRSQRRTIHTIKSKVDKVYQDVKKFKGVDEDENFKALMTELEHHRVDLKRKSKDLQPQVRNVYDATLKKIEETAEALKVKLEENREKFRKKEEERAEKAKQKEEKEKKKLNSEEGNSMGQDSLELEQKLEALDLESSPDKRKTVELKIVQIYPPTQTPPPTPSDVLYEEIQPAKSSEDKVVSPEEKRKSILKVGGVSVMPSGMVDEISTKSLRISTNYKRHSKDILLEDPAGRINEIIENLQAIECQIADFVGRKHGTQYTRIRDTLNQYLVELSQADTNDEFIAEQIKMCKNYVGSCLSFLDEKAVDDKRYDSQDDVFLFDNNNVVAGVADAEAKLQKLSKTTAI